MGEGATALTPYADPVTCVEEEVNVSILLKGNHRHAATQEKG